MNRFKVLVAAFCLIFIASLMPSVTKAQGQNGDKKTVITFNEPIEIPGGAILPPGTYFFKLLDAGTGRFIVQISNANETHMFATLITIQNFRYHPTDKVVMTFGEREAGAPPAIRAWFFPGENFGREFVYPKPRAIELAKQTNEPVLAMPAEVAANISVPVATPDDAPVVALKEAPVVVVTPAGAELPLNAVIQGPPIQEAAATTVEPVTASAVTSTDAGTASLPQTASSVPLIGLIGLLAISAAFGLAILAKQHSA
jgi:hypothetical protein